MESKTDILLVLKGPKLSPATADPLRTLDLARAYFGLLQRIATEHGARLELHGLHIRRGSLIVASRPNHPDLAVQVMTDASRYMSGALPPPPRLEKAVGDLRGKILELPANVEVSGQCGDETRLLTAPPARPQTVAAPPRELAELRATVIAVGGTTQPVARFASRSEERPFSLRTTHEMARKLGRLLYVDVDLTAEVQRDERGLIHSGSLHDFQYVAAAADEVAVWRDWFRTAGGDWNDIDDVEQELDRV